MSNIYGILALDLRKHQDVPVASLIDRLEEALAEGNPSLEGDLVEARAELERVVRHSHQVQEGLEQLFQADQAKRRQIEEMSHQLSELQRELNEAGPQRVEALEQELVTVKKYLSEKSAELESVLSELERYFLQSRQQMIMINKYEKLQDKSVAILQSNLIG